MDNIKYLLDSRNDSGIEPVVDISSSYKDGVVGKLIVKCIIPLDRDDGIITPCVMRNGVLTSLDDLGIDWVVDCADIASKEKIYFRFDEAYSLVSGVLHYDAEGNITSMLIKKCPISNVSIVSRTAKSGVLEFNGGILSAGELQSVRKTVEAYLDTFVFSVQ